MRYAKRIHTRNGTYARSLSIIVSLRSLQIAFHSEVPHLNRGIHWEGWPMEWSPYNGWSKYSQDPWRKRWKILALRELVQIDGTKVVLDVLRPDWDILLILIQSAFEQLPGLCLKYVKGHQDNKLLYDQLPLLVRLNFNADTLAGQFQNHHGQDCPIVLLTSHARVQIHLIEQGTIKSSLAAALCHAYCGPPLLE